jgi:pimeloyl-ACP methyl ester carboxylesterase
VAALTTAGGRRLGYRTEGEGPLLLCHPGGPGFDAGYLRDLAGLGRGRRLLLLDPRGTGASDRPSDPRAYTTDDYVADVEELRVHLGVDRLDFLGHSHGGVVAMAYAAAHPSHVRRLALASTLPRFAEPQKEAMEEMMEARAAEPWYEDARAALEAEQAGAFETEDELHELVQREMPFYTARYGDTERALPRFAGERQAEPGRAQVLQRDDVRDVRPPSRPAADRGADARHHRRAGLHHRTGQRARDRSRDPGRAAGDPGGLRTLHLHRATGRVPRHGRALPGRLSTAGFPQPLPGTRPGRGAARTRMARCFPLCNADSYLVRDQVQDGPRSRSSADLPRPG